MSTSLATLPPSWPAAGCVQASGYKGCNEPAASQAHGSLATGRRHISSAAGPPDWLPQPTGAASRFIEAAAASPHGPFCRPRLRTSTAPAGAHSANRARWRAAATARGHVELAQHVLHVDLHGGRRCPGRGDLLVAGAARIFAQDLALARQERVERRGSVATGQLASSRPAWAPNAATTSLPVISSATTLSPRIARRSASGQHLALGGLGAGSRRRRLRRGGGSLARLADGQHDHARPGEALAQRRQRVDAVDAGRMWLSSGIRSGCSSRGRCASPHRRHRPPGSQVWPEQRSSRRGGTAVVVDEEFTG